MRGRSGWRAWWMAAVVLLASAAATTAGAGQRLGELTWPEAKVQLRSARVVVLPFAAGAKEHGPHLPLNTDALVMNYLLQAAVQDSDALIAPPILHGWFPAFRAFPGTEVADPQVFQAYVQQVAESLLRHGAQRLVLLNLGIARATGLPLTIVARELRATHGVPTLLVNWDDLETDAVADLAQQQRGGHADELETSVVLALQPQSVAMARAQQDYRAPPRAQVGYAPGHFGADESGVFGDPTLATAAKGEAVLAIMRSQWLLALQQFASRPLPEDRR